MAKILDPDDLTYIVDGSPTTQMLRFNTTTKRIRLVENGAFTYKDGVTGQCLFSKIKDVIKASSILISVDLPIKEMIHDESMELINDWQFEDTNTLKSIRDCGVAYIKKSTGLATAKFACFVTLGPIPAAVADAALYFVQSSLGSATSLPFTHVNKDTTFGVNELVQFYSDTNGDGTPDYNYSTYAKVFLRPSGYTYDESSNLDIGYPALTYKKYNFPITTVVDAGVTKNDATVDAYTGMSITWNNSAQSVSGQVGGPFNYHVIINGNTHTHDEVYSWVQRQLRLTSDLDVSGVTRNGNVSPSLVYMDGATLKTRYQNTDDAYEGGVHVSNINAGSLNFVSEADDTGAYRAYPLSVTVICEFDSYLQGDAAAYFWVFRTSDYGTPSATPILDSGSNQMKGAANVASASFPYTHSVDVPLTGIALGESGAKIATAYGTITNTGTKLVFVAGQERWYTV